VNQGQLDFVSYRIYDSSTLSSFIVTISPSTALAVNGTVVPFSLIVTVEHTSSGSIKVTVTYGVTTERMINSPISVSVTFTPTLPNANLMLGVDMLRSHEYDNSSPVS
jgi:hypothetical protein